VSEVVLLFIMCTNYILFVFWEKLRSFLLSWLQSTNYIWSIWIAIKFVHYLLFNQVFFFYWRYIPLWVCILQPSSGLCPPRVRGFLITHNDAPQSVGLLWTSDQSVAETSIWQHTTLTTDIHLWPPEGFEPTISAGERPKTYTLDRAATGTSNKHLYTRFL
jgi:hypothetical protein